MVSVEDFVEQSGYLNTTVDSFQMYRDKVDLLGQYTHIMQDNHLKTKKEDRDQHNEVI